MSDIWHTSNEKPEVSRYYLEEYEKFSDGVGYLANKRYGIVNTIDDLTTKRWCYLDDLLGLETENKDLSDKIGKLETELERTRKALEVAKDAIDVISLKYHKDTPSIFLIKYAQNAKTEITALEQKDVK